MRIASVLPRPAAAARADGVARPQLTSLVDMLTILLVFLLKSFSVEGNLVSAGAGVQLPDSSSPERPAPTLNVEITPAGLNVDGLRVAALPAAAPGDSLLIGELHDTLQDIAAARNVVDRENAVTIHCDKRLDFAVVKRVMYTCARASFSDFSLLVLRED